MSRTEVSCPSCSALLGHRRQNGNLRFRSIVEPAEVPNAVYLRCACGSRVLIDNVVTILMSATKE